MTDHTAPPSRDVASMLRSLASSSILQQAGWLAASKMVQGACSIVATLVVGRHLGPAAFGLLSLASALALFVGSTASLGLEQIATRELATLRSGRYPSLLSVLRRIRGIGALAGAGLVAVIAALPISRNYGISSLLFVLCLLPIAQTGDLSEWRLIAAGRSRAIATVALLSSPLAAIARVVFALSGAGVAVFAWLLVGEWALRSLLMSLTARERPMEAPETEPAFLESARALLRDSVPLLLGGIAVFVYMRIDQFMLAAMLGPREVGLYSAVVSLAEAPLVLPVLLLRAALPVLSRHPETDRVARDRKLMLLMRGGFFSHLALALVVAAFASPLMSLLYGQAFEEATSALRIQVLAAPFVAMGVLSSAWLVLHNHTGHILHRTLVGAALNVSLNFFMIPRHGIAGAAAATLAAQATAGYVADLMNPRTRELFRLKTFALLPMMRGSR